MTVGTLRQTLEGLSEDTRVILRVMTDIAVDEPRGAILEETWFEVVPHTVNGRGVIILAAEGCA
jgi:hypothetical protein